MKLGRGDGGRVEGRRMRVLICVDEGRHRRVSRGVFFGVLRHDVEQFIYIYIQTDIATVLVNFVFQYLLEQVDSTYRQETCQYVGPSIC